MYLADFDNASSFPSTTTNSVDIDFCYEIMVINQILINLHRGINPSSKEICKNLKVCSSTLNRGLKPRNTNFLSVKINTYKVLSAFYTLQGVKTQDLAKLFHYGGSTEFIRAFKSWNEYSPGKYKVIALSNPDFKIKDPLGILYLAKKDIEKNEKALPLFKELYQNLEG